MTTRRLRGDRGSAFAAGLLLMFAFTAGAVVWLARDVDRSISNRSAAQSIAFQAARSGAREIDVAALRTGSATIDTRAARSAASSAAATLFASYGVEGRVTSIAVTRDGVTVAVAIEDAGRVVNGHATARAETGPDGGGP